MAQETANRFIYEMTYKNQRKTPSEARERINGFRHF